MPYTTYFLGAVAAWVLAWSAALGMAALERSTADGKPLCLFDRDDIQPPEPSEGAMP